MSLQKMIDSQEKFQEFMGHKIQEMDGRERTIYLKEMMIWCQDELFEMLHELPYAKYWSTKYDKEEYNHEDQLKKSKEEYIDFFCYALNIGLALGLNEEEILKLYKEKNQINYERQENGY